MVASQVGHGTHLAIERAGVAKLPQCNSSFVETVDLSKGVSGRGRTTVSAPVQPQQDVKVTGNVVQLSSRRK